MGVQGVDNQRAHLVDQKGVEIHILGGSEQIWLPFTSSEVPPLDQNFVVHRTQHHYIAWSSATSASSSSSPPMWVWHVRKPDSGTTVVVSGSSFTWPTPDLQPEWQDGTLLLDVYKLKPEEVKSADVSPPLARASRTKIVALRSAGNSSVTLVGLTRWTLSSTPDQAIHFAEAWQQLSVITLAVGAAATEATLTASLALPDEAHAWTWKWAGWRDVFSFALVCRGPLLAHPWYLCGVQEGMVPVPADEPINEIVLLGRQHKLGTFLTRNMVIECLADFAGWAAATRSSAIFDTCFKWPADTPSTRANVCAHAVTLMDANCPYDWGATVFFRFSTDPQLFAHRAKIWNAVHTTMARSWAAEHVLPETWCGAPWAQWWAWLLTVAPHPQVHPGFFSTHAKSMWGAPLTAPHHHETKLTRIDSAWPYVFNPSFNQPLPLFPVTNVVSLRRAVVEEDVRQVAGEVRLTLAGIESMMATLQHDVGNWNLLNASTAADVAAAVWIRGPITHAVTLVLHQVLRLPVEDIQPASNIVWNGLVTSALIQIRSHVAIALQLWQRRAVAGTANEMMWAALRPWCEAIVANWTPHADAYELDASALVTQVQEAWAPLQASAHSALRRAFRVQVPRTAAAAAAAVPTSLHVGWAFATEFIVRDGKVSWDRLCYRLLASAIAPGAAAPPGELVCSATTWLATQPLPDLNWSPYDSLSVARHLVEQVPSTATVALLQWLKSTAERLFDKLQNEFSYNKFESDAIACIIKIYETLLPLWAATGPGTVFLDVIIVPRRTFDKNDVASKSNQRHLSSLIRDWALMCPSAPLPWVLQQLDTIDNTSRSWNHLFSLMLVLDDYSLAASHSTDLISDRLVATIFDTVSAIVTRVLTNWDPTQSALSELALSAMFCVATSGIGVLRTIICHVKTPRNVTVARVLGSPQRWDLFLELVALHSASRQDSKYQPFTMSEALFFVHITEALHSEKGHANYERASATFLEGLQLHLQGRSWGDPQGRSPLAAFRETGLRVLFTDVDMQQFKDHLQSLNCVRESEWVSWLLNELLGAAEGPVEEGSLL